MKLDDGRSREDGDGPQVGSAIMKLPKGLSIVDKPYLVKEDIMKSDVDIMYDNFVASPDEMLA